MADAKSPIGIKAMLECAKPSGVAVLNPGRRFALMRPRHLGVADR